MLKKLMRNLNDAAVTDKSSLESLSMLLKTAFVQLKYPSKKPKIVGEEVIIGSNNIVKGLDVGIEVKAYIDDEGLNIASTVYVSDEEIDQSQGYDDSVTIDFKDFESFVKAGGLREIVNFIELAVDSAINS